MDYLLHLDYGDIGFITMNAIITPFKERTIDRTKPVKLYRCLNRRGHVYSLKQNGYVVGHTEQIKLIDCVSHVSKSGQSRCRNSKQRNVHAWLEGRLPQFGYLSDFVGREVTYNPYKNDSFVYKDDDNWEPFDSVDVITVKEGKVYGKGFHNN